MQTQAPKPLEASAAPASASASASASSPAPAAPSAQTPAQLADEGRRRYTLTCARCHGLNLVSLGNGFDLRTFPADDKARFVRSVTQGLRAMPALGGALTAADLDALWAYLGAVNGWPP
jgi:mono/diheme cytochrome c family protein